MTDDQLDERSARPDHRTPSPADDAPDEASEVSRAGFVAIIGKPNVGKSTLLNTMLGVKVAPITSKPQTTRRGVRGIYSAEQRQLVFVDTPGYHRGATRLDGAMNRTVRESVIDVEAVLWVVDLRRPPSDEDKDVARLLRDLAPGTRVWLVGNKVDAAKYPDEALSLYRDLAPGAERVISISALNDPDEVYALRDDLLELLPESPFYFPEDVRSDQPREVWAAELIRESVMTHLRQELPYAVAVVVDEWRESGGAGEAGGAAAGDAPLYLHAEIWVEKQGHRPIVLGRGGAMIKAIGRTARKQLEVFLQQRVYLDLEVVVRRAWRDDRDALRELGYEA